MDGLVFPAFAGRRVHLGVCGSVSAYKAADLMRALQKAGFGVSVTLTSAATEFIAPLTFTALGADTVHTAMFCAGTDTPPFGHLEPGCSADVLLIAPASADTIARLAHGLADTMLAAQALAFTGPIVIAPAMNPKMWGHPATQQNIATLQARGVHIVAPATGLVACGESGQGRLAPLADIYHATARAVLQSRNEQPLCGKNLMLTLGPTREEWDSVRYWSNHSTGFMGACLATAAWYMGATVHAIAGPGCPALPYGVQHHAVVSAKEMFSVAQDLWPAMDAGLFAAAVADFSPTPAGRQKIKKGAGFTGVDIHFTPNPDILASLAANRTPEQKVLGFAAETNDLETQVRAKLRSKQADIIAGNVVGVAGSGFGSPTNTMFIADRTGKEAHWPNLPKPEAAWRLLQWLCSL